MTTLAEFETYFVNTYIVGCNIVQDVLSQLFNKSKPNSYKNCVKNITSALNRLKILKNKKLERSISDIQIENTLIQIWLPSDQILGIRLKKRAHQSLAALSLSLAIKMKNL